MASKWATLNWSHIKQSQSDTVFSLERHCQRKDINIRVKETSSSIKALGLAPPRHFHLVSSYSPFKIQFKCHCLPTWRLDSLPQYSCITLCPMLTWRPCYITASPSTALPGFLTVLCIFSGQGLGNIKCCISIKEVGSEVRIISRL